MILILGGTKSGKTSFASGIAAEREERAAVAYLATAQAKDAEMADRIRHHRAERPSTWITVEEPLEPARYFQNLVAGTESASPGTVLFDCVTLWLTNLLTALGEEPSREDALAMGECRVNNLLGAIRTWENSAPGEARQCLLVSNRVEEGLISPWALGRIFQDLAGLTHQRIAAASSEVYLLVAGLAQRLK